MNYLGLDFGLKHIGIAFSDGFLASPLTTISIDKAAKMLPAIIDHHQVDKIIIGRPDKTQKFEFEKFIKLLKSTCPEQSRMGKLRIVDETLSSHDARQKLLHTTQKRRKNLEHSAAATLILQSWLDSLADRRN
jgi:putative transcription antitermination factor YqgF